MIGRRDPANIGWQPGSPRQEGRHKATASHPWPRFNHDDVIRPTRTSPDKKLDTAETRIRLDEHGFNVIARQQGPGS